MREAQQEGLSKVSGVVEVVILALAGNGTEAKVQLHRHEQITPHRSHQISMVLVWPLPLVFPGGVFPGVPSVSTASPGWAF